MIKRLSNIFFGLICSACVIAGIFFLIFEDTTIFDMILSAIIIIVGLFSLFLTIKCRNL